LKLQLNIWILPYFGALNTFFLNPTIIFGETYFCYRIEDFLHSFVSMHFPIFKVILRLDRGLFRSQKFFY